MTRCSAGLRAPASGRALTIVPVRMSTRANAAAVSLINSGMRRHPTRIILAMQVRALRVAGVVSATCCLIALRSPGGACPVGRGQPIVLASQELDPDVFLWDSADRIARYAGGDYSVQTVLKHTTLVRAYSRAVVVNCRDTAIRPAFAGRADPAVDLVGVKVTSGASRGRFGWVLSADVRRSDGSLLTGPRHR
jgi:hypothetical protein